MHRISHIIICFLAVVATSKTLEAQEGLLHGRVIDDMTGIEVPECHILLKNSDLKAISNAKGYFELPLNDGSVQELEVTHVSYQPRTVKVTREQVRTGEELEVRLIRKMFDLPMVEIGTPAPEVVYQRPDLHVATFEVNENGVWVLAYDRPRLLMRQADVGKKIHQDVKLVLLDTNFIQLAECAIPEAGMGLHVDHSGRLFVIGEYNAFYAACHNEEITLEKISRAEFERSVLPWTDSIPGLLVGSNFEPSYPAFDHFVYSPTTEKTTVICSLTDEHRLELFRSQYKYLSGPEKVLAMNTARELGLDKETVAGITTGFANDPYYKPLYAPLYIVDDTLRIFDHCHGTIRSFDMQLEAIGEEPLGSLNKLGRDRGLLQDRGTENVYSLRLKNGRMKVVPLQSEIGRTTILAYTFPEEVRVFDGMAYYIYRPFGSLQKKTLYREAIGTY